MNSHGQQRVKLRTKTGCLTCACIPDTVVDTQLTHHLGKSRRKKCDEQHPVCQRCTASERCCKWPSTEEMTDRRYSSKRSQQASPAASAADTVRPLGTVSDPILRIIKSSPSECMQLSRLSESTSIQAMRYNIEPLLVDHFANTYYSTILLPDCHADFYHGWIADIQRLMKQHKSVYYSVLACSASQIHSLSSVPHMGELALDYYSQSIKEVSRLLDLSSVATHDGPLNSIILLYLHGVCLSLSDDIRRVQLAYHTV